MKRRAVEKVLPPQPPVELLHATWPHRSTYGLRVVACVQWNAARRAWLAEFGWGEDELTDLYSMGRPLPAYLVEFVTAGPGEPFDPAAI